MGDPFSSLLRSGSPFDDPTSPDDEARVRAELASLSSPAPTFMRSAAYPQEDERGLLSTLWGYGTSPLRALAGITGTPLAQGLRTIFPDAYERARAELEADEAERAGPDFLRGAATLPAVGDVAVQGLSEEFQESLPGRVLTPVARIGLNILGDPTAYAGAGIFTQLTKVGRAARALGVAQKAEDVANVPRLAGALAEAAGAESAVGRGARRLLTSAESLGRSGATGAAVRQALSRPSFTSAARPLATLPFSPLVGVAYAPELAEGVSAGFGEAWEEARAGRYAEAAASGVGAILTTGLGILVGRGVLTEARAVRTLENAISEQLGEPPPPTAQAARTAATATTPPGAAPGPAVGIPPLPPLPTEPSPATPAAVAPSAAPGVPTVPGEGAVLSSGLPPGPPAVVPPVQVSPAAVQVPPVVPQPQPQELVRSPDADRVKVDRSPKAEAKLQDLVQAKLQEGGYLTKRDLVEAGLVTPKQAKSYPLETLLDALGATPLRARLENVPGYGFRFRPEPPDAPADAPGALAAPIEEVGAAAAPPLAPAAPPALPPSAPTPPAPGVETPGVPARIPRSEIDRQLAERPELREMVDQTLDEVAAGRDVLEVDKTEVAQRFPGEENKQTRALLYRALEARKKIARVELERQDAMGEPEPRAALTFPGEARQPRRTPEELLPRRRPVQLGVTPEQQLEAARGLQEPTGIGERVELPSPEEFTAEGRTRTVGPAAINTREELGAARAELDQIRNMVAYDPSVADEFAARDIQLDDAILSALRRGVGTPSMEEPLPALRPEPPEPRPVLREPRQGTSPARPRVLPQTPEELHRYVRAGAGPRRERFQKAVVEHMADEGVDLPRFRERVQQHLGRDLDDTTPEQLSLLFSLADKNPDVFGRSMKGVMGIRALDPQLKDQAGRRLMGENAFRNLESGKGFQYDPHTPAGDVQQLALRLENQGFAAEQMLQDKILRWIANLSLDDDRFVRRGAIEALAAVRKGADEADALEATGKVEEASQLRDAAVAKSQGITARAQRRFESARNLRRLLLSPSDDPATRSELARLLRKALLNRGKDFFRGEGTRFKSADAIMARREVAVEQREQADVAVERGEESLATRYAAVGLSADEARSLAVRQEEGATEAVLHTPERLAQLPEGWQRLAEALRSAGKRERYVGRGGTAEMAELKKLAQELGISLPAKASARDVVPKLTRALRAKLEGKDPAAAAATPQAAIADLLTDQLVAQRGRAWTDAVSRGTPIADTDMRVVDFEGDAGDLVRVIAQADPTGTLANAMRLTLQEVAARLDYPSRFGGWTPSPQIKGLRMGDGSIYLNPLHARESARLELRESGLEGEALTTALNHKTAQNLVDVMMHEIAHRKARHDAATGDASFIEAYARAIEDLGPTYADTIRDVRTQLELVGRPLDEAAPRYTQALDRLRSEVESGRYEGADAGTGQGGAQAQPGRGGAAGGPADRPAPGVRPIRPIPEGREGQPLPRGAADRQGAAGGAAEAVAGDGGRGGEPEPGPGPSASLTDTVTQALAKRRKDQVFARIQQEFAREYARYAGSPQDADRILREIEAVQRLPLEQRERLRKARPQGEIDIGLNLTKFPVEAMSDEQKETLGMLLALRNHFFSRSKPMTEADVREGVSRLLETHTLDESIDWARTKGLRDPADFAFLRAAVATFGRDVDEWRGKVRAAEIRGDETGLELAKNQLAHAGTKQLAAIFTLIPETTRAARVLASLRYMAYPLTSEETFRSRFYGAMRSSGIKKEKAAEFYTMLQDTIAQGPAANWSTFVNAFRQATQPRFFDKFLEFWKAGLLGIPTQMVNITTNAAYLGLRNVESGVSVLASTFFSGLTGKPRTRFVGEIGARAYGGRRGLAEGWSNLKTDLADIARLKTPDPYRRLSQGTFFDDPGLRQLYGAIEGKKGEFIRIPFKLLDTFDNFFKHIIRNQEWAASAHRLAQTTPSLRQPGENVTHATSRILEELRMVARDPLSHQSIYRKPGYKQAIEAGRVASIQDTFQENLVGSPMRDVVKKWQEGTNRLPALQLVTPFIKTPYNILAEAMKRTPVAAVWTIIKYAKGEIDNPRFVEDMVKSAIGTSVMGAVFAAASAGEITGGGPADPKEAELLKRTGWQPRSIKIGNNYYSYQRLAPFSVILGLAADMAEAYKRKDVASASELMEKAVASISDNIFDQSFITGLDSMMKILTDPQRQGLSAMRQMRASLVPNVVGVVPVAHLARATDPYYRETSQGFFDPMLAQIPGLSQSLPAQLTPTGEPRPRKGSSLERLISPIMRSEVQEGPVAEAAAEIARVGPKIEAPGLFFRVGQEKVYYTLEERQTIARAQERAVERVARLIRQPQYLRLPDGEDVATAGQRTKKDAIQSILNQIRRPVVERTNRAALRRAQREEA